MSEVNPNYNPQAGGKTMMDVSGDTFTMNLENYTAINTPNYVGGYRLGNDACHTQFNFTYKPNWFHRTMMRLCFGLKWVNL